MAARAVLSGTISFGLVSIPVKFFTAALRPSRRASTCCTRSAAVGLKMQFICPTDNNEVVERSDTVKGYEYSKGQYVQFTRRRAEGARDGTRRLDLRYRVRASLQRRLLAGGEELLLGPDKGGDKAYRLLGEAMTAKGRVAVGRWSARGKEQVVLVRPYGKDGSCMHQLYYANEMRAFSEMDTGAHLHVQRKRARAGRKADRGAWHRLVRRHEIHATPYSERVKAAVDQKVAGQEITIAPEAPKAQNHRSVRGPQEEPGRRARKGRSPRRPQEDGSRPGPKPPPRSPAPKKAQ